MIIYQLIKFQSEGYGIQDEYTIDYFQSWDDAKHIMEYLKLQDVNGVNSYQIYNIHVVESKAK